MEAYPEQQKTQKIIKLSQVSKKKLDTWFLVQGRMMIIHPF